MKRFLVLALFVSLAPVVGLVVPANADVAYEVVDLTEIWSTTHPLAESIRSWESVGLNDAGDIAGTASTVDGGSFAFVWNEESGFRDLSGIGFSTIACAINQPGQVAVASRTGDHSQIAHLWNPAGDLVPIVPDDRDFGAGWSFISPREITDLGQVVGVVYAEQTGGFFWDGTEMTVLYGPDGPIEYTQIEGIDGDGRLVGFAMSDGDWRLFPCIWTRDDAGAWAVEELDSPSPHAIALHVNDSGVITGTCAAIETPATNPVLCRWADGEFLEIGALGNGATPSFIDDSGMIGGCTDDAVSLRTHAFLWTEEDGLQDLNDIVTIDSGWYLRYARDANSSGVLLAQGASDPPVATYRELLLRPVPEPGLLLCVATLASVLFAIRPWRKQ